MILTRKEVMGQSMMDDRRKYQRFDKEIRVIMKYESLDHFVKAVTENVSLGGMCLSLRYDPNIRIGRILNLQFELEGFPDIVEIKALVKWTSDPDNDGIFQVGIEFTQLDNPEMRTLKERLQGLLDKKQ
ncbi:MAG: PilZ domain-containing protein [Acidobacteria bacterium]|nr:PilZ domain-containing protein [Acidobacteriota bacterium]